MITRWAVERKVSNADRELLQVVVVYAPGENKELIKQENRQWSYRRELLLLDRGESQCS